MSGWMCRAPKLMTGLGRGGVDALARGRGPAGRLGEHPEERGLVQAEPAIARPDAEDDLLRRDAVAVVERLEPGLGGSAWASTWPSRFFASSIPHRTASCRAKTSIETIGSRPSLLEDALRPAEVDVGRVAGQDLVRGSNALQPHQSGVLPSSRGAAPSAGGTGPEVAASVAYGPRAAAPSAATRGLVTT